MEYGDKGNNISDGGGVCLRVETKKKLMHDLKQ